MAACSAAAGCTMSADLQSSNLIESRSGAALSSISSPTCSRRTSRSSTVSFRTRPRLIANEPTARRPIASAPMAEAASANAPNATAPSARARLLRMGIASRGATRVGGSISREFLNLSCSSSIKHLERLSDSFPAPYCEISAIGTPVARSSTAVSGGNEMVIPLWSSRSGARVLGAIVLAAALGNASSRHIAAQSAPVVAWANTGEDKVTKDEMRVSRDGRNVMNSAWDGQTIHVFGARNEVVNFNAILEAPNGASNVSVSFDSLVGPNGTTIGSQPTSGDGVFDFVGRNIQLF